jgi:hypothetical protein
MPRQLNDVCAGCSRVKGEVNHWFAVRHQGTYFVVYPWSEMSVTTGECDSYCGQACVAKALSVWMQERSVGAVT